MELRRPIEPLTRRPIYQMVQDAIKAYIIENRLKPGDPLPAEGELAEQLGVGRNSVREAVKSLEVLGILRSRVGSGLYVRSFSFDPFLDNLPYGILSDAKTLADSLEIRLLLESSMVDRVIEVRSEEQLAHLREILGRWSEAAGRGAYPTEDDRAFHRALYENVGNALLISLIDVFWEVYRQARAQGVVPEPTDPTDTYQRHVLILEALEVGDHERLRDALAGHTPGIKHRVEAAKIQEQAGETVHAQSSEDAEARRHAGDTG